MSEIIEHNFGKEDREHIRRFCRLLGLLESREADVKADPVKYLNEAGVEIARLRREIFAAWEVAAVARSVKPPWRETMTPNFPETMTVRKEEYLALKEVYRRIAVLAGMASP